MPDSDHDATASDRRIANPTPDIAASVVGAIVGYVIEGPIGSALGAISPALAKPIIQHTIARLPLPAHVPRAGDRIEAMMMGAIEEIVESWSQGRRLRSDGFFAEQPGDRSAAQEVADAVITAVTNDHEERKAKYVGHLFGHIAVEPELTRAAANALVAATRSLSYQQLCLLNIFANKRQYQLRSTPYQSHELTAPTAAVLGDLRQLDSYDAMMIPTPGNGRESTITPPGQMNIGELGLMLYKLMRLSRLPVDHINETARLLC